MSVISVSTAVTGQTITASLWNTAFTTVTDDYNGGITNANISASAGIAESKLSFNTSTGHSHDGSDSKLITINRGFTWGLLGGLATGDEQGMKYIVPQNMTVTNIRAKTGSGTATIRIQTNTTSIDASADVTSSVSNETSFDSTALTAGQVLTLDITAVSSCVDLFVTMECEA